MVSIGALFSTALILLSHIKCSLASDHTFAFIYYQDASCSNDGDITGTAIYAYNNKRMSGRGFVKENYHGNCKYFQGGYFDFMYDSVENSYMKNGYCIRCNGLVGCTSTQYSCSGFSTVIPNYAYTLSQNETYSMEDNTYIEEGIVGEDDDNVGDIEYDDFSLDDDFENVENMQYTSGYTAEEYTAKMELVEQQVYKEISQGDSNAASLYLSIMGVFLGMCSLIAIKLGSRAIRRLHKKHKLVDANTLVGEKTEIDYNGGAMI